MPPELVWVRGAGRRARYVGVGRASRHYRGIADLAPARSALERAMLLVRGQVGRSLAVEDERILSGWQRLRAALPDTTSALLLYTGFYKDTILSGVVVGRASQFVKVFSSMDGHERERQRLAQLHPVVPAEVTLPELRIAGPGIVAYPLLDRGRRRPSTAELEQVAVSIGTNALQSTAPAGVDAARWTAFVSDTETLVAETGIVGSLDLSLPVAPPPATVAHGDFTPWNALRTADGRIAIVDYERVGLRAPFTDAWHLATQAPALRGRVTVPGRLVQRIAHEVAADPHAVRDWYRAYLVEDLHQDATDWVVHHRRHPQLRRLIRTKHALLLHATAERAA